MVLLLLNGGGKVSEMVGGGQVWRHLGGRGDVDGDSVGGHPVLVVARILDKVPDFGLHQVGLPLGDHGGPGGVAQGAVQGVRHEG